jgi:hypothetical protein
MPELKEPKSMQDQVVQSVVKVTRNACVSWIRKLREAAVIGSVAYLEEKQNVMTECDKVHDHLASLPIGIPDHIARLIIKEVIFLITVHDETSYEMQASWYQEEEHNTVCAKILRSVLLNSIREYEMKFLYFSFTQN